MVVINTVFQNANLVIKSPYDSNDKAKFQLTRLALGTGLDADNPELESVGVQSPGCLETEPKLGISLDSLGRPYSRYYSRHKPPAVLLDTDENPSAFLKNQGRATSLYLWRSAHMQSAEGPRFLPANSIVGVKYSRTMDHIRADHTLDNDKDVMVLTEIPQSIRFRRFSLMTVHRTVAHTALSDFFTHTWGENSPYAAAFVSQIPMMSRMTPGIVQELVDGYY